MSYFNSDGAFANTNTAGTVIVPANSGLSIANGVLSVSTNTRHRSANFVIDGGTLAINTGSKGYVVVDFDCTISSWTILSDVTGSAVVDVKKCTYANFPTTTSITGSDKPTLTNSRKNQNNTVTSWTSTITSGDILEFVVDSASTTTRLTVDLKLITTT